MRTERELAETLVVKAVNAGAAQAEAYVRRSRSLSVDISQGVVDSVEMAGGFGFGLRVIKDGRQGFSYSNDEAGGEDAIAAALDGALYTEADEYLGLPGPQNTASLDTFDPNVEATGEADAIERALVIERAARSADARVTKTRKASAVFSSGHTHIANSRGVSSGYSGTYCSASLQCVAEEAGEGQMGWDYQAGRFLSDIDFEGVGTRAALRAVSLLGARRIEPRKARIVLDSAIAAEFLGVFASMLSAEAVQKGRSLLKGRVGERVIAGTVDIIDDGLNPRRTGSRPVDDEGVPVSKHAFIEGGVLTGFMHNTYTARRDGAASTGNAVRGGYSALPSVGPIGLTISAAGGAFVPARGIIESLEAGLHVVEAMGMHTVNPISGEFSLGVSGLWIEHGKVMYPIKEAVVSGNLLEFFMGVEALGDDMRQYGSVSAPSLLMGPVEISA